jgi:hypothetical protein
MAFDYLNWTRRSVAWIKQVEDDKSLDLHPPFQRNPVWSIRQKAFLIDTILRGYPIPEIYMQELVDAEGSARYVLVDGQQRIRACLEFLEGRFALNQEDSPEWPDMSFEELSDTDRKKIFSYNFVVRVLPEVSDEELRKIFQRLNRNVLALNKQELRHATYWGQFIRLMEKIAENPFWEGAGVFTANDIRRMLDIEFISELTVGLLHGPQNKKSSLDKWYEVYETEFDEKRKTENTFTVVLAEIMSVLPSIRETRWRQKSDFYTLFSVFADKVGQLPLSSDNRMKCRKALVEFGDAVTRYISEDGQAAPTTVAYARAVGRAASDLNNRKTRQASLSEVIGPFF